MKFEQIIAGLFFVALLTSCDNKVSGSRQNTKPSIAEIPDSVAGFVPAAERTDSTLALTESDSTYCRIYCFCFTAVESFGKGPMEMSLCLTPSALTLQEVLHKDNLMVDIRDGAKVKKIGSIFTNYKRSAERKPAFASHFIVLLKLRGQPVDTFQYVSARTMLYNQSFAVSYPYSVLG
ncbi:MAG: hypothetical protein EOO05_13830, partial [Chitinophagaceae bacterium]